LFPAPPPLFFFRQCSFSVSNPVFCVVRVFHFVWHSRVPETSDFSFFFPPWGPFPCFFLYLRHRLFFFPILPHPSAWLFLFLSQSPAFGGFSPNILRLFSLLLPDYFFICLSGEPVSAPPLQPWTSSNTLLWRTRRRVAGNTKFEYPTGTEQNRNVLAPLPLNPRKLALMSKAPDTLNPPLTPKC